MNEVDYQRLLFDTAMLVMACDDEIHDDEIEEIKRAFQQSVMFRDLEFHAELDRVLAELNGNTRKTIDEYFDALVSADLDPVQRLKVLEIVLRIMYADDRVDENETRFLQLLKTKLDVGDEIFYKRFGEVESLRNGIDAEEKQPSVLTKLAEGFRVPSDILMEALPDDGKG